jgi:hypothetical protein
MTDYAKDMMHMIMQIEKDADNQKQIDELKGIISSFQNDKSNKEHKVQKLKWLGKPEQFGYIFSELARQGFIEMPGTNGEGSYAKYAKVCFELFEFKTNSLDNLERVLNPEKNVLSDSNRAKISIPDIKDIS